MKTVKWLTLENAEGTRTLAQHAYKAKDDGNKALCCGAFASDDGEYPLPFAELSSELLNEKTCCKKCLKISGIKEKE
jgi:hypothetical protein